MKAMRLFTRKPTLQIYIDDDAIPVGKRSLFFDKQTIFPDIGDLVDLDRHPRVHIVTDIRYCYNKRGLWHVVLTVKPRINN